MAEAEGTVTFLGKQGRSVYLEISSESGSMPVIVLRGSGTDLLLRSRIRVRGICRPIHDSQDGKNTGSLSVTNANDLTILQLPEETWQRFPVCAVNALTQTNPPSHIVHLRGRVQSVQAGRSFELADETGQVAVNSPRAVAEMAGTEIEVLCEARRQGANQILESVFVRPLAAANPAALPALTTSEQVRWLKPDEANRQYPAKVRGVITFIRGDRKSADLQDGTGGVFLWNFRLAQDSTNVNTGDFCEVEGVTSAGDFSPQIIPRTVTFLGAGQFPPPAHPTWDELIHGGLDAQWVEVEGVVLSVTNRNLDVGIKGGGHVLCFTPGNLESYVGAIIRARGVVLPAHDNQRRIVGVRVNVPSQKFISVETPAPGDPFQLPLMHVRDLFTYNPDQYAFQSVKIAGQITHVRNRVVYVMDGTNGLRLIAKNQTVAGLGDLVEAVGFPDIDRPFDKPLLTLREAVVRQCGRAALPQAEELAPDDLLNRAHDATLVKIKSQLVNAARYGPEQVLEMQSGGLLFSARLNNGRLPQIPAGSRLELTGVYAVSADRSVPFELLLNSPAGVRVLELPSWWTARHALIVICAMVLVIFLAVVWIGLLHQQVSKRTLELSSANQSLKSEIAERKRAENELVQTRLQHLVEQERTRIARDLHDDLGSRVTRVVLLLDELALQNHLPTAEAPEHPLGISAAAREVIQSLDETVWAVNPRNSTLPHLFNYLSHFAIEFLKAANVRCRLDFPDHPPALVLSTEDRHNLFLAVKEALNNAVRHAQATEVRLRAAVSDESLVLTVEDNGRGFESPPNHPSADGLRNMRQRMEEIGGQFAIVSAPNAGTKVTLTFFWSPRVH